MVYYKFIFGILFLITFVFLFVKTGKQTQGNLVYQMVRRTDILLGILAGVVLIVTSFAA
ncbi:hypothetical protein [Chryseolinea lacunae]|uniref:DUF3976 domain-containing protein n=1 Tax=Chryseolinea lacunae TaxID=2801331 RepID=A0ABS1KY48_9BACT|nr:hypothetical protein [Chryseolinea lacunae]MBL0744376.1 hypothetical protein [Chryseolinea lacunae]